MTFPSKRFETEDVDSNTFECKAFLYSRCLHLNVFFFWRAKDLIQPNPDVAVIVILWYYDVDVAVIKLQNKNTELIQLSVR